MTAQKQATPNLHNQASEIKVSSKAKVEKPLSKANAPIGVKKAKAPGTLVHKKITRNPGKPKPTPPTHAQLMAAAGIQSKDYAAVDYVISHESSWNPNATEPTTHAHGLPQALPYSKTGCAWSDAVCQLKWASTYAVERYGSWQGAYAQWVENSWW